MKRLAKLAAAATVAAATTTILPAQVPKATPPAPAEAPKDAAKFEITVEFNPAPAPRAAEKGVLAPPAAVLVPAPAPRVMVKGAVIDNFVPQINLRLGAPAPPGGQQPAAPEALVGNVTQQLRPLFRAELRFLTSAAGPSPAQRREVAVEGARAMREAAKKLAEVQQAMQQGGWRGGAFPDARKLMAEGMLAAARSRLAPEQIARYQAELDRRARDQREVIALNLVANFDRSLVLSPEQRGKLGDALLAHWDEMNMPSMEMLPNYEAYAPVIPDTLVNPILDGFQKKAWQGLMKVNFGQSFNFNFNNGGMMGRPEDEDEDEKAALAETEKKP